MKEIKMTEQEWRDEGVRRFGTDPMQWKFVCPSCGHVATPQDWKDAGAGPGEVAFSCVGRHMENAKQMSQKPGPCNYAGGGLIGLNPVLIKWDNGKETRVFAFAEAVNKESK